MRVPAAETAEFTGAPKGLFGLEEASDRLLPAAAR